MNIPAVLELKTKKNSYLDHCLFPVKVIDESLDVLREGDRKEDNFMREVTETRILWGREGGRGGTRRGEAWWEGVEGVCGGVEASHANTDHDHRVGRI